MRHFDPRYCAEVGIEKGSPLARRTALVTRATVIALLLLVSAAPSGQAVTAAKMPPQLKAFASIFGHSFTSHIHHAGGKLRLNNLSGRRMDLSCVVTVTWATKSGRLAKRSDRVRIEVGARNIRWTHFRVRLHDGHHDYLNIPRRAVPHCRKA